MRTVYTRVNFNILLNIGHGTCENRMCYRKKKGLRAFCNLVHVMHFKRKADTSSVPTFIPGIALPYLLIWHMISKRNTGMQNYLINSPRGKRPAYRHSERKTISLMRFMHDKLFMEFPFNISFGVLWLMRKKNGGKILFCRRDHDFSLSLSEIASTLKGTVPEPQSVCRELSREHINCRSVEEETVSVCPVSPSTFCPACQTNNFQRQMTERFRYRIWIFRKITK